MKPLHENEANVAPHLNVHLDDDAFAELAMGGTKGETADAKVQAHLMSCAACREELARFEESVGSFNRSSLAWSEEKSEGLPALRPAAFVKGEAKAVAPRMVPGMSWVLALLLAIGVAVPSAKMHFSTVHDFEARNLEARNLEARNAARELDDDPSGLNSPEQIAKDNQLMADVNYEAGS